MFSLAGIFGWLGGLVGGAVSSLAGDAITALAKAVLGALGHAVEWASTLWVGIGTPSVADGAGRPTGTVAFLQQNLLVFTTGLAVLCTLLGAGRIVYHEHKAAQLRELGRYLVKLLCQVAAAWAPPADTASSRCETAQRRAVGWGSDVWTSRPGEARRSRDQRFTTP